MQMSIKYAITESCTALFVLIQPSATEGAGSWRGLKKYVLVNLPAAGV